MRSPLSLCALLMAAAVAAVSTTGDRLLVVFNDVADKAGYSKFLGDLESVYPRRSRAEEDPDG